MVSFSMLDNQTLTEMMSISWHTKSVKNTCKILSTNLDDGLTQDLAEQRMLIMGPNEIPADGTAIWRKVLLT